MISQPTKNNPHFYTDSRVQNQQSPPHDNVHTIDHANAQNSMKNEKN